MPRSTVTVLLLEENYGAYDGVANQAAFRCESEQGSGRHKAHVRSPQAPSTPSPAQIEQCPNGRESGTYLGRSP